MSTMITETLRATIDAPFDEVASDLADPSTHPEWEPNSSPGRPARAMKARCW